MKPGAWRKDLSYSEGGKILFFRGESLLWDKKQTKREPMPPKVSALFYIIK